jgi:tetratricopeptide (TPR) repeat protein
MDPSWVYLARAGNLLHQGEYAQALIEANRSRQVYIDELVTRYHAMVKDEYRDKTEYELKRMIEQYKQDILQNDNYPAYHELSGDIYTATGFLEKAEIEYKRALAQKEYFEYPQKAMEIRYKLADVYAKWGMFDFEEIMYREIVEDYFAERTPEFWNRIRYNIANDTTLGHVFRIYRIDGMEYLWALYKIGQRSALMEKHDDALFFLSNAAIIWMTDYSSLVKARNFDFQYASPSDLISYFQKKKVYSHVSEDYFFHEILFYIGYVYHLKSDRQISDLYFDLAMKFSKGTGHEVDIRNRVNYFTVDPDYTLTWKDIVR